MDVEEFIDINSLIETIHSKIISGEAPAELIAIYEKMRPENFGFWLHGFYCGIETNQAIYSSQICQFLRAEMQNQN